MSVVLTIDQGNSSVKYSLFDNDGQCLHVTRTPLPDIECIPQLIAKTDRNLNGAIYASVAGLDVRFIESLRCLTSERLIVFTPSTPVPISNGYKTPSTLGADRLAAASGAATLYPNQPVLIVDAGSALTCDLLSEKAHYIGGIIAPGVDMRLSALNAYTSRLPKLHWETTNVIPDHFPSSTRQAMLAGAIYGAVAQIEYAFTNAKKLFPNIKTILTGGNAEDLLHLLKHLNPHYQPNLVAVGLNRIFHYNESSI